MQTRGWRETRRFSLWALPVSPQLGGEVRLAQFDGATLVMVDNDGDTTAEMVILIHGATGLVAGDFIL